MGLFSVILNCFMPSSSSKVSDDDVVKVYSSDKSKSKSKSSGAPLVVPYFPVNSMLSRL
ncbi:hypothetical protein Pint_24079 [Pistacia integerrima]|uniref:Uncharacterized protein n=1 Tax=Pistacia integerrima TaxID=434235 RepID=A0ACC0YM35_9ROSI|nr:hypothetical protein Pint_24079 [Pistacia integerrima]